MLEPGLARRVYGCTFSCLEQSLVRDEEVSGSGFSVGVQAIRKSVIGLHASAASLIVLLNL